MRCQKPPAMGHQEDALIKDEYPPVRVLADMFLNLCMAEYRTYPIV